MAKAKRFVPCVEDNDAPYGGEGGNGVLVLPIKAEWLERIIDGEKREEYRAPSDHYIERLHEKRYKTVLFRNGYAKNAPTVSVEFVEAVFDRQEQVFVIRLGRVLTVKGEKQIRATARKKESAE